MPDFLPVEIRLVRSMAGPVLNALFAEKQESSSRLLQNGQVKLDTEPSVRGVTHLNYGSVCLAWYVAGNRSNARQVRESSEWAAIMQMPRHLYPGKLIDIMRGRNGVYLKIRTMSRRDERHENTPAYRNFNPAVGTMLALIINPSEAILAEEIARSRQQGNPAEAEQLQTAADEVAVRGS